MRIGVACGGTGGHIYPGLATAEVLRERGHDVSVWLAGQGIEAAATAGWDGPVVCIEARGFGERFHVRALGTVIGLVRAIRRARRELKARPVSIMVAMGSYASVGPVIGAWLCRIPVVVHEANAVPGRAVSLLSRFARLTAITFPAAAGHLRGRSVELTGLPLRAAVRVPRERETADVTTVLVMGGSQGAHAINELASNALCRLHGEGCALRVAHLAGRADEVRIRERYTEAGVDAEVHGYLDDMASVYAVADLAICRSGAASCMELMMNGIPAIFIPLPAARRDHQRLNAEAVADIGGAVVMQQAELSADALLAVIRELLDDAPRRHQMRDALLASDCENGAARLADIVEREAAPDAGV